MTDDRPMAEMLPEMEHHVGQGATVFPKWMCPAWGFRLVRDHARWWNCAENGSSVSCQGLTQNERHTHVLCN